ncbi:hypothetical protein F2Q70_00035807 [Brassica cretica]|uniref:Uncharacterized protein n=1 Tax=Brassica cretica TaxID=69181 RepID=A0A8S9GJX6_BRACR|nr:hypothetical protein F2Q68_00031027 [Brassica cretica]KAF2587386.1 hypothetical protein F2Q70_00035807 [Brassica cretica]
MRHRKLRQPCTCRQRAAVGNRLRCLPPPSDTFCRAPPPPSAIICRAPPPPSTVAASSPTATGGG